MYKIYQAEFKDKTFIIEAQILMAKETEGVELDKSTVTKGVEAVFSDPTKGIYWVTKWNNEPIASLLITFEWSDWRNKYIWWIQSVYVLNQHRGKGTFKQMYQHLKKLVEETPDAGGLRLYVDKTNKSAQKVYEKLGMNGNHYQLFEWMNEVSEF